MRKTYQGTKDKSKQKFEVLGKRELLMEVLPMVEVWSGAVRWGRQSGYVVFGGRKVARGKVRKWNYRRAVESVLSGYGIEKSSVSREFVAASAAQLQDLCEKKLDGLDLVAILIDGMHLGKQVLVMALGIETSGEKHVLGLWQGATENTTMVKELLEDLVARGLDP